MLLGIKWYHFISNDEVRCLTNQPLLTEIIQARRLTLFRHIARMDDNIDAKQILTSSPSVFWKRPPASNLTPTSPKCFAGRTTGHFFRSVYNAIRRCCHCYTNFVADLGLHEHIPGHECPWWISTTGADTAKATGLSRWLQCALRSWWCGTAPNWQRCRRRGNEICRQPICKWHPLSTAKLTS